MQIITSDELLDQACHYFRSFKIPSETYLVRVGSLCEMFKELQFQQRRDINLREISDVICQYTENLYRQVTHQNVSCRDINTCCKLYPQIDDALVNLTQQK